MSNIKINEAITIGALIEAVRAGEIFNDDYCLYAEQDVEDISADLVCYLDDYPDVVDDVDRFSEFVTNKKLHLIYYGDQFLDVLNNLSAQRGFVSTAETVNALNYYMKHDDFWSYD